MSPVLDPPWLEFDLGAPMQVLSWAPYRPGLVTARRILWREVRNADLPEDLDAHDWLAREVAARQRAADPDDPGVKANAEGDSVCFLTSRHLDAYLHRRVRIGRDQAEVVATVGLSNAERVGHRLDRSGAEWGTINVAVRLKAGLSSTGLLEALSIVTQARTAAVMEAGPDLPTGRATGTGTDCIAVAAPEGGNDYAGLHTETGEAIGRAVHQAVSQGARDWRRYWDAHGNGLI